MANRGPVEAILVQPREDHRVTEGGIPCLCYVADPTDLTVITCWLEDHLGRRQKLQCVQSTGIVLLQVGELGDLVFDPAIGNDGRVVRYDGLPVFRQRKTLGTHEIKSLIEDVINQVAREQRTAIIPGHFGGR